MIEPPTLHARISAQAATFTLCSDTSRAFDDFLREHDLDDRDLRRRLVLASR